MFRERLNAKVASFLTLNDGQLAALEAHFNLLKRWNKVLNLTRIEELDEVIERHYAESLFVCGYLPKEAVRIVDVGSGGGFPGVPVAIARPDCAVTLVESHRRKAVFLREASRHLSNIRVLAVRAESLDERFDVMVARAVRWRDLSGLTLAPRALILGGEEVEGEKTALPWGKSRFLVCVSRGTLPG